MIKKGFTMIELSPSMVFIGLLLVSIAAVTIQVTNIYQKGLAIRTVNATGQELVDEFSRAIKTAPTKGLTYRCNSIGLGDTDKCSDDGAYVYIYHQDYAIINLDGGTVEVPTHGVFCTGRYSYAWNTGYSLGDYGINDHQATLEYNLKGETEKKTLSDFRLIRIVDDSSSLCRGHAPDYINSNAKTFEVSNLKEEPYELLTKTDTDLVLYDFVVFRPTQHSLTLLSFFSGTFILGTIKGGVNITSTGDYCTEPPDNLSTDFNYCMINKFNFAIRATGELTDEEKVERQRYL